jgi:hypothetical protein
MKKILFFVELIFVFFGFLFFVKHVYGATPDCSVVNIRCVGSGQEYSTIQAAHDVAVAGDTVFVYDGNYAGFEITRSGQQGNPITFKAIGSNAVIDRTISGKSSKCNGGPGICFKGNGNLQGVHDVVVEGFKITNLYECVASHDASPITNSSSEYPHKRITLRGNVCTNAGHEGFYLSEFYDSLIEGNIITGSANNGSERGHGIYLANAGSDNTIIRGNTISGTRTYDSAGIHFNGDLSVGGDGMISGLLVENNTIYNGGQNGLNMDGVDNSVIRNNLIYGNAYYPLRAYAIDASKGPANLTIVNNTFIVKGSDYAIGLSEDRGGHIIFNNILIGQSSGAGSISVGNTNFQSDYNIVSSSFSRNQDSSSMNLANWQSYGKDTHSVSATSVTLFLNSSAGDYHLLSSSPALNIGVANFSSTNAPTVDIEGAVRPQGTAFDVGAYEYSSGTTPTPKTGDLNNDNKVDIFDYNIIVGNFGKTGSGIAGDIDANGKVDIFDYNLLVGNFGK